MVVVAGLAAMEVMMVVEAMEGEAVVVAAMEAIVEAAVEALVAEEVVVGASEEAEVEVVMGVVAAVEDLVVMTGRRKCRVTIRSLSRACPPTFQRMTSPSSLAPLEQSRLIARRANFASSSTLTEILEPRREKAQSPMRIPVLHSLLYNGSMVKNSAREDPSKLAWP